jgi:hypothetical protein
MWKLLFSLCVLVSLSGCGTYSSVRNIPHPRRAYHHVVLMNARGELVSSWTSEGKIKRVGSGYKFKAVERRLTNPPREFRYPLGWVVTVQAPKVVTYRVPKPQWMWDLRPGDVAIAAEEAAHRGGMQRY